MSDSIIKKNTKDIILESIYDRVPFYVYLMILNEDNITYVSDLRCLLDDDMYDFVLQCVNEHFVLEATDIYLKYLLTVGGD